MTLENEDNELHLGTARFGESDQSEDGQQVSEDLVAIIDLGSTQVRCGFMG